VQPHIAVAPEPDILAYNFTLVYRFTRLKPCLNRFKLRKPRIPEFLILNRKAGNISIDMGIRRFRL